MSDEKDHGIPFFSFEPRSYSTFPLLTGEYSCREAMFSLIYKIRCCLHHCKQIAFLTITFQISLLVIIYCSTWQVLLIKSKMPSVAEKLHLNCMQWKGTTNISLDDYL